MGGLCFSAYAAVTVRDSDVYALFVLRYERIYSRYIAVFWFSGYIFNGKNPIQIVAQSLVESVPVSWCHFQFNCEVECNCTCTHKHLQVIGVSVKLWMRLIGHF
jgi:hypothetical protein